MNKKLLAQYGLKWNPFAQELPVEGLRVTPALDSFCWRVEALAREGGFALVTGEPGTGKSCALRVLADRLGRQRELSVGILTRPQSGLADFYRELGELFGLALSPHNRWAGTKLLRERWRSHIDTALSRPVLIIDEAQEVQPPVLNELRLLSSSDLDSRTLLTVVLAGDSRLVDKLKRDELTPLASRVRVRLRLESASSTELAATLRHGLEAAGNNHLMTDELVATLADHAAGNQRVLSTMAAELLIEAARRDLHKLDEKLYFDVFSTTTAASRESGEPSLREGSATKRRNR